MGQAPSAEADIQHADLACAFDKDLDPPCLELVEAALEWTKDAWLAFERDPSVELNFGAFPQADAIYASGHAIRRKLVPGRFVGIR